MPIHELQEQRTELQLASCITCLLRDGRLNGLHSLHLFIERSVLPLAIEAAQMRGEKTADLENISALHQKAASGIFIEKSNWRGLLEKGYLTLFRLGFDAEKTYRQSHASALEFSAGNLEMIETEFGSAKAYADYYGRLNSEANTQAFARANAEVHAAVNAKLFASGIIEDDQEATLLAVIKISANAFACSHAFSEIEQRRKEALLRTIRYLKNSS
ncbi:hypothetical protein [Pseudovibrio sp. Tun.PSC04-5.I4]|uniref:hypothetical protein n=1 Tax=Pseudovibrio sp. Tun.PSC04-5.I4 TaxID=1798213 RepID=UPI00088DBDF2|nr:hypothetical protein [Pseudovibrio sp. Tun.PSC04-5.I4]SDQ31398.1 hypothetical protein SAMN04515695_0785 [Pseudovibrio sp. Tun.PSC04-5.I4]